MARLENWNRVQETEALLEDKARFCLLTGVQPSEFDAMTDEEIQAFVDAHNAIHKSS